MKSVVSGSVQYRPDNCIRKNNRFLTNFFDGTELLTTTDVGLRCATPIPDTVNDRSDNRLTSAL